MGGPPAVPLPPVPLPPVPLPPVPLPPVPLPPVPVPPVPVVPPGLLPLLPTTLPPAPVVPAAWPVPPLVLPDWPVLPAVALFPPPGGAGGFPPTGGSEALHAKKSVRGDRARNFMDLAKRNSGVNEIRRETPAGSQRRGLLSRCVSADARLRHKEIVPS
jgi:hypothetical protein